MCNCGFESWPYAVGVDYSCYRHMHMFGDNYVWNKIDRQKREERERERDENTR